MAWQEFPLRGFAPDLPSTTPGTCVQTRYVMPTDLGLGNGPTITEDSTNAMSTVSMGGCSVFQTNNTQRIFVGTATKLYEFSAPTPTTLTDRSDTAYSATTTDTWSFCQYGDVTFAVNKQNILRQINAGAAFAAVGIAPTPKASIIVTCGPVSAPIVMAFDYDDGTNNYTDGWFASGLSNPLNVTGWTTGTNSCVNGRLLDDIPGPITAAIGFRDGVIAFKATGMYVGSYTGDGTNPWAWQRISSDIGCIGKNAVCRANDVIYFADSAGIWQYDGSYPRPVAGNIHNYWAAQCATNSGTTHKNYFKVLWDKPKHVLHVFSGSATTPSILDGMSWNSVSGLWTQHQANLNPFTLADGSKFAAELISARVIVTNNKKAGTITWGATATEPKAASVYGWIVSDWVTNPLIKGIRPHWSAVSVSGSQFGTRGSFAGGSVAQLASEMDLSAFNLLLGTTTSATFRAPGKLDVVAGGPSLAFVVSPNAATNWEMTGLSLDLGKTGKS